MTNFRKIIIYFFFIFLFLIAVYRLINLTLFNKKISKNRYSKNIKRGTIYDKNNLVLAVSDTRDNIYINLSKIENKNNFLNNLKLLVNTFKLDKKNINYDKINTKKKVILFAYQIKIDIKKLKKYILKNFKPGQILSEKVYKRVYPYNDLLSDIVGFVGRDNIGLGGIEYLYDNDLVGLKKINKRIPPYDLKLTIDIEIQKIVQKLLKKYSKIYNVNSSMVIVQNVNNGEIIASADYPYFNPNNFEKYNINSYINTAISEYFEPGSTFKMFASAFLLENNLINPNDKFLCTGSIELINGEIINCTGIHGYVNLRKIIKVSCNSGMIQAMARVKPIYFYKFLKSLNFDKKTGVDLPGEINGIMPLPRDWGIRTRATIPIGQGIGVTGIQLISAFSSLINGGTYYKPRVFKNKLFNNKIIYTNKIVKINKVISKKTSLKIIDLLRAAVEKGSTGHRAYSKYLDIGGKTGTAQISGINIPGYLKDSYNSIFIGGFPLYKPKFSILVVLYKMKKKYYGGVSSAPLFKDIAQNIALYYNIIPKSKIVNININNKLDKNKNSNFINSFKNVPNFKNMTLRQAIQILLKLQEKYNIEYDIIGSGIVKKQNIKPGTKLVPGMKIILTLKL